MNARILLIPLIALSINLTGCSVFGWKSVKPVEIQTKAVERTPLNIPEPPPFKARKITWVVITPENADQVWEKLRAENTDPVLFALTDEGYETMALTMTEIRNLVAQQRAVNSKYRLYYEPKPVTTEPVK